MRGKEIVEFLKSQELPTPCIIDEIEQCRRQVSNNSNMFFKYKERARRAYNEAK